jgi:AraC-like DNA-binding protein
VTYQMPHMILTRVRGGAMIMRRGPEEIANDPNPPLLNMHVQLAGESEGTAAGRPYALRPGGVLFYDYARPLECANAAFECITLLLARDRAHPAFLRPDMHGALLRSDGGPARLIAATAAAVHSHLDRLSVPQADLALQSLADLGGRMLENHLATAAAQREADPPIKAALTFIDGNLDDAALSSAMLAAHLGLSRSALYRVFEPLGGVDNAIRRRRLDRAMRAILTDNGSPARKARAGFNSEEQFARAFQARFGERPARYRAVVAANDSEWLKDQALRMGFPSLEAWIEDLERGPGGP